jgi:hypothetical protein
MSNLEQQVALAEAAGFGAAAAHTKEVAERARRLVLAYEHYRYVSLEKIEEFKAKLCRATEIPATPQNGYKLRYDTLAFHRVELYTGMPPANVLEAVKEAKARAIFDYFEVAQVETITERKDPDPIVFGRIEGCTDYFYIAQWGDDVKITDLISEGQG